MSPRNKSSDIQEIVLSAKDIYKDFFLPHEKSNSLKSAIVNVFKKRDTEVDIQHALKGVSFEIHKGEFFGILGRNGSGKSTLLKILADIYQPTKGGVFRKGKLVPFIELGVGFNPELTGRENVYLNGALLGFSRREIDDRYDEIVKFAELEDFMEQKLKNYSSGMQVRLAFSVATRAEADILLVDEVLAVGDADFQRKCYDYFKALKDSGKTVVFVTHDMGAVREYCDKAVLIKDGKISKFGKSSLIADEYLKLFIKKREKSESNVESKNRWGTEEVVFTDVKNDITRDKLVIDLSIKNNSGKTFNEEVDVGIDIYCEGILITGTNYIYENEGRGMSLTPGDETNLHIEFPNHFTDYTYSINLNIKTSGGNNICDEWHDAMRFTNDYSVSKFFRIRLKSLNKNWKLP